MPGAGRLAGELGIPRPVAEVLIGRGLADPSAAADFLEPRLASLSPPEAIAGMPETADAVESALRSGRRIAVFGDYDVDGVTAAALAASVLRRLGGDVRVFLPLRAEEGYGLSAEALRRCVEETGADFVLTVDCGIRAEDRVREAAGRGIDVVVTDHHDPPENLRPAGPVLNPKLGAPAGAESLSGVGVVFKLAHALVARARRRGDPAGSEIDLRQELDLVALGTVADVVPLLGENRVLVRHGLRRLENTPRIGLRVLIEKAGIRPPFRTHHVGFGLAPRLNAMGRLDDATASLRLLEEEDADVAGEIASRLEGKNRERRELEETVTRQAEEEIARVYGDRRPAGIIVGRRGWHPGVVGIVASRLARRFYLPAFVLSLDDEGMARGSGRSVREVPLVDRLRECGDVFERFGGHPMAAGVTLRADRIGEFRRRFEAAVSRRTDPAELAPTVRVESVVRIDDLSMDLLEEMEKLRPFGSGNPEPVFGLRDVRAFDVRPMGREGRHVRLRIRDDCGEIGAVAWNRDPADFASDRLDVAVRIRADTYRGPGEIRLEVEAVRPAGRRA